MSASTSITADALDALVGERLPEIAQQQRKRLLAGVSREALAWVAASNDVPPPLVGILGLDNRPSSGSSPLEAMLTLGVLEARTPAGTKEVSYTVSAQRQLLANELLDREPTLSVRDALLPTAQTVMTTDAPFGDSVRRLANLIVTAHSDDSLVDVFEQHVSDAFEARSSVAALEWTETCRALATLMTAYVKPDLNYAVERAARRIELLHRRRDDMQRLRDFMPRQEQIDAIRQLIEGPDEIWAMHLLGAGGVGKTMLVRHLTVNLESMYDAAIARVDFDYLNPDYPRRHPGLLLWALAEELRMYDVTGEARELFDKAGVMLQDVQRNVDTRPGRATDDPQFISAVAIWNLALNALGKRRIILILDTCEELAKVRQEGVTPASVEETFRILRAVHDGPGTLAGGPPGGGVPQLRVIFAGRRPLAKQGPGWACRTSPLPERDFLLLHELRGFTEPEARAFLRKLGAPDDLVKPILDRSPEVARPAEITTAAPSTWFGSRYNPYLLSYFGRWAAEEPESARELIPGSSGKRYIELRVLQRIRFEPLSETLPLIAAARHVDAAFLRAATELSDDVIDRLMDELADSEWTDMRYVASRDGSEPKRVVTMKAAIRQDLIEYFNDRPPVAAEAIARGGEYLKKITTETALSDLDWTSFDAALWILGDRDDTVAWWAAVEERAIAERGYVWLLDLTSLLLGEDGAAAERRDNQIPLRASVLASHAIALLHVRRDGVAGAWSDVVSALHDQKGERWEPLRIRAKLGLLANRSFADLFRIDELLQDTWADLDNEATMIVRASAGDAVIDLNRIAAIVAACENVIEHLEELDAPSDRKAQIASRLARAAGGLGEIAAMLQDSNRTDTGIALRTFIETLLGRAAVLTSDPERASRHFINAVRFGDEGNGAEFRDWLPPEDLGSRMKLELIRGDSSPVSAILDRIRQTPPAPSNEDSERLLSAYLTLAASIQPVEPQRVMELMGWTGSLKGLSDKDLRTFRSQCAAHRATRPLFVTAASILAGAGRLDDAVSILIAARNSSTLEPSSVRDADRLLLDLAFRFRLHEANIGVGTSAISSSRDPADKARIWSLEAYNGRPGALDKTPRRGDPREAHAVWTATPALSGKDREIAMQWQKPATSEDVAPALDMHLRLDVEEVRLVSGDRKSTDRIDDAVARLAVDRATRLRICLRGHALEVGRSNDLEGLARDLGYRAAAIMALDEGTHLLLRLPSQSIALFKKAGMWFDECHDSVGLFLTTINETMASLIVRKDTQMPPAMDAYGALRVGLEWPDIRDLIVAFTADPVRPSVLDEFPALWRPMETRFLLAYLARHEGARLEMKESALEFFVKPPAILSIDVRAVVEATAPKTAKRVSWTWLAGGIATLIALATGIQTKVAWNIPFLQTSSSIVRGFEIAAFALVIGALAFLFMQKRVRDQMEGVLGCGCLIAIGAALFIAFQHFTPFITYVGLGWQIAIFISLGSLLITSSILITRRVQAFIAAATDITLSVSSDAETRSRRGALSETVNMSVTIAKPRLRLFPLPRLARSEPLWQDYVIQTGGFAPYRDVAAGVPDALVKKLKEIVALVPSDRTITATLLATSAAAGPAWEALAAARVEDVAPSKARLRMRRTVPDRAAVAEGKNWTRPVSVVGWAATSLGARVIEEAWASPDVRVEVIRGDTIASAASAPASAHIVHLVGVFDERSSGIGIRGSDVGSGGEVRVDRAETVRHRVPAAEICIVQGDLLEKARRSEADRQDAMLARRFAAELVLAGFPVVFVLPRLTSDHAIAAVRELRLMFERTTTIDDAKLVAAVQSVQRTIGGVSADGIEWEMACDVTLYCAKTWHRQIEGNLS